MADAVAPLHRRWEEAAMAAVVEDHETSKDHRPQKGHKGQRHPQRLFCLASAADRRERRDVASERCHRMPKPTAPAAAAIQSRFEAFPRGIPKPGARAAAAIQSDSNGSKGIPKPDARAAAAVQSVVSEWNEMCPQLRDSKNAPAMYGQ